MPDDQGNLRDDATDLCAESISAVSDTSDEGGTVVGESESEGEAVSDSTSEGVEPVGSLPYLECFDDQQDQHWKAINGGFRFNPDDSGSGPCTSSTHSYRSADAGRRNLSVWDGFDDQTSERIVRTDFKMLSGTGAPKRNAGIVLNWQMNAGGLLEYFLVDVDYDAKVFRVLHFNGTSVNNLIGDVSILCLQADDWYRLKADVRIVDATRVSIQANLDHVTAPALSAQIGPFNTTEYYPDTGLMGLHANRAHTRFAWFEIKEP